MWQIVWHIVLFCAAFVIRNVIFHSMNGFNKWLLQNVMGWKQKASIVLAVNSDMYIWRHTFILIVLYIFSDSNGHFVSGRLFMCIHYQTHVYAHIAKYTTQNKYSFTFNFKLSWDTKLYLQIFKKLLIITDCHSYVH